MKLLVNSNQIDPPRICVSPPFWILVLFWLVFITILITLTQLQIDNIYLKYGSVGICGFLMLGVLRNQLKGDFLVTMQANKEGMYFQTSDTHQYLFVPWKNVGLIEKAIFPLNSRGIRIEITGESGEQIKSSNEVGNVSSENGHTFIYTLPQLRNRKVLIEKFESLKMDSLQ